jgi:hypothetical protein
LSFLIKKFLKYLHFDFFLLFFQTAATQSPTTTQSITTTQSPTTTQSITTTQSPTTTQSITTTQSPTTTPSANASGEI